MKRFRIPLTIPAMLLAGGLVLAAPSPSRGAGLPLIRDAEIENTIRHYATPLLRAAGLDPAAVRIHLVRDKQLNAFVAGGQRIFITTGLLKATEHPGQLTGVLAHEIGHIEGGHLARLQGALKDAQTQILVGNLAALLIGVLARNPGAAGAGISGTGHLATRNLLQYARGHERAADQAAARYLDQTGQSARGMLEFLETLSNQELLVVSRRAQRENKYDVTHPGTRDRIAFVQTHVQRSRYSDVPAKPDQVATHARIVAKLDGFLDPPSRTFRRYKRTDRSVTARYARAIAHYRKLDIATALEILDGLLAEHPNDPYFWELKGQILTESARLNEALPAYRRSAELLPREPLILVSYAHVQIELERADLLKPALLNLKTAIGGNPNLPMAWRLTATAYDRLGKRGLTQLAFAEYNLTLGRKKAARKAAKAAQRTLKKGSRAWGRAGDILSATSGPPGTRDDSKRPRNGGG